MVIIFKSEKARNYLLTHGAVYTMRARRRKMVGNDWMTDKRLGKKLKDVYVQEIGQVHFGPIPPKIVEQSGFSSLGEWEEEYCKLHSVPIETSPQGWLYRVRLR